MKESTFFLPLILILSIGLVDMATDIYVPTMPCLCNYFLVSEKKISLTISLYLVSFCASGLVYGVLSDTFGRRPIFLAGLSIFSVSSFLCSLSLSCENLIIFRFLQGIGGGMPWVLGLAMAKDLYPPQERVKIMSTIGMVATLAPAAAPIAGGYIGALWGWHMIFWILAALSFCVVVLTWVFLPETLPPLNRQPFNVTTTKNNYLKLIKSKPFIGYCMVSSLSFAGLWAYLSVAPFFFIQQLGVSIHVYGFYQMACLVACICGTLVSRLSRKAVQEEWFLEWSLRITLMGGICFFIVSVFHPLSCVLITLSMAIYCFGMAMIFSGTSLHAMEIFPEIGGGSSALLVFFEMSFSALAVWIASACYKQSLEGTALLVLFLSASSLGAYKSFTRRLPSSF